ncbi:MAG TPA: ATP-binding protein [Candidatus Paceibacterota bacterium]|nr:ATP-binding protein [Candidatus Paceibacterota bacterium]
MNQKNQKMNQKPQTELEIELANKLHHRDESISLFAHDYKGIQAGAMTSLELSLEGLKKIIFGAQSIIDDLQDKDSAIAERVRALASEAVRSRNYAQISLSSVRRSDDLANLLALSGNNKENINFASERFSCNKKLKEIFEAYQHYYVMLGLNLRFFSREDEAESEIFMHPGMFSSIVGNIVTNASKYGVRGTTINFVSHNTMDNLVLECENHIGREMTDEELEYIQRKGNSLQLNEPNKEKNRAQIREINNGFGVSFIKQHAVEEYGGKVKIKSSKHRIINPDNLKDYKVDMFPKDDSTYLGNGHPHFYISVSLPLANLKEPEETLSSKPLSIEDFSNG